jgi:hypothetical protein
MKPGTRRKTDTKQKIEAKNVFILNIYDSNSDFVKTTFLEEFQANKMLNCIDKFVTNDDGGLNVYFKMIANY